MVNLGKEESQMQKQFTKERTLVVKGVAIILLLIYHLFEHEYLVNTMGVNYSPFSLSGFLMFTGFGNICVAVFVLLTAYGISKGLFACGDISVKDAYGQAVKRFFKLMANFTVLYASVNLLWWYKFDYTPLYGDGWQGLLYGITDGVGLSQFFDTPTMNMTWWYMEIAYVLIILVPFLAFLTKKVGYAMMLVAFVAPAVVNFNPDMERYFFIAVFGVCAAYGEWPDKLLNLKCPKVLQWIVGVAAFILCVPIRQNFAVRENYSHLVDAPVALLILFVGGVLLASVPVLNKVLAFIGKHSMNIYLVHTFFYMLLWRPFIYQFEYAGVTLLLLLVTTLAYSVVLELVKGFVLFVAGKVKIGIKKEK